MVGRGLWQALAGVSGCARKSQKNRFACLGSALFLRGAGLGVRPKLFEACFPLPQSVRRGLGLFCAAIDLRRARFSCFSLGLRSPQVMYFAGQQAVAGLGAEPSEKPRTARRTFQIQNPICGAPETRASGPNSGARAARQSLKTHARSRFLPVPRHRSESAQHRRPAPAIWPSSGAYESQ